MTSTTPLQRIHTQVFRPTDILKKLEPIVRPAGAERASSRRSSPVESLSFDELIDSAQRSPSLAGQRVHTPPGMELTDDERSALIDAADCANRGGSRASLVLVGDRAFVLDVPARAIEREVTRADTDSIFVDEVDSAVLTTGQRESGASSSAASATLIQRLGAGAAPPTIAEARSARRAKLK